MIISKELRSTYKTFDPESDIFFDIFDEDVNSKVLEVGSQDSPIGSLLAKSGFKVTGVDLRPLDQEKHPNYTHITGDFCKLPAEFYKENYGSFDCVVTVSAIEHFGLQTYGEPSFREYYDVLALRYIYDLLKPGGVCYLVVPFGGKHINYGNHWRVYSWATLHDRLIQDFYLEYFYLRCIEKMYVRGETIEPGTPVDFLTANLNIFGFPQVGALCKLRK